MTEIQPAHPLHTIDINAEIAAMEQQFQPETVTAVGGLALNQDGNYIAMGRARVPGVQAVDGNNVSLTGALEADLAMRAEQHGFTNYNLYLNAQAAHAAVRAQEMHRIFDEQSKEKESKKASPVVPSYTKRVPSKKKPAVRRAQLALV